MFCVVFLCVITMVFIIKDIVIFVFMMKQLLYILLAGCIFMNGGFGGDTGCPSPEEVWSHAEDPLRVIKKFNYSQFARNTLYYELAYHDYTQKPACPNPTCITSTKTYNASEHRIYDSFRLKCVMHYYTVPLYFDETDINGYLMGEGWIPNIIVDFDPNYEWVIEFQCLKYFKGINVYSRIVGNDTYLENLYSILKQYELNNYTMYRVECNY